LAAGCASVTVDTFGLQGGGGTQSVPKDKGLGVKT
jgi:hypothetical protein